MCPTNYTGEREFDFVWLVPNKDKTVQNLVSFGFIWDLKYCHFQLLPEKLANLIDKA